MTPDTQLSEAVERLRTHTLSSPKNPRDFRLYLGMEADLRTVLADLDRLQKLLATPLADIYESWRAAALRSSPRFTQEDLDFLAQCERDETNGTHGFINEHAAAKFRDLAGRISQAIK